MKNKKTLMIILTIAILLVVTTVYSQVADLSLNKKENCKTVTWSTEEPVYKNVTNTADIWGECTRFNEVNQTDETYYCVTDTKEVQSQEQVGTKSVEHSEEKCLDTEYVIRADGVDKYKLAFEQWGACKYENVGDCVVATCVSNKDGGHHGEYTGCRFGMSCQQFTICPDGVTTLYKNSRDDFVANDPSFKIDKLQVEVLQ